MRRSPHPWRLSTLLAAFFLCIFSSLVSAYDWPQFNGTAQHTGNNPQETILTAANVHGLQRLFQATLPAIADGAPAVLQSVSTAGGVVDLVFVTTKDGQILARNARTGAPVWGRSHGPGSCHINTSTVVCYTTSSPAIDPNRQYVYTYGLDGYVHKHRVTDGLESTSNGWPEPTTTKPSHEKGSSALSIATAANGTSYLYVAHAGYPGDEGDYQGHVTAIDLTNGAQHVFNTLCSGQAVHFVTTTPDCTETRAAIWARPGVVYDPRTDKIYMATGNGAFDGVQHWGDTVFALHPDGTGAANGMPLDSYTPTNYLALFNGDLDLGSTAPAILPVPPGSSVARLAVQGGKDQLLRLLNLDNLSGQGGPGHTGGEVGPIASVPQGGEVLSTPAVWINPADSSTWIFVTTSGGIAGMRLTLGPGGVPRLQPVWQKAGGTVSSPLVAGGVLFDAVGSNVIAYNPVDGGVLWQNPTPLGGFHWESPVVANGVLYIADEASNLTAYALPGTNPLPPPRQPQGPILGTPPALLPNPRNPTGQPAQGGPPAPLPARRP